MLKINGAHASLDFCLMQQAHHVITREVKTQTHCIHPLTTSYANLFLSIHPSEINVSPFLISEPERRLRSGRKAN
ncbi:hypothetical protein MJO05_23985, partial [Salmonella enterica subsp. enterica serovar Kentucky]|nr:hypothetical protein [Salmonella enterica subsp. enterica serovar Kentucky]